MIYHSHKVINVADPVTWATEVVVVVEEDMAEEVAAMAEAEVAAMAEAEVVDEAMEDGEEEVFNLWYYCVEHQWSMAVAEVWQWRWSGVWHWISKQGISTTPMFVQQLLAVP